MKGGANMECYLHKMTFFFKSKKGVKKVVEHEFRASSENRAILTAIHIFESEREQLEKENPNDDYESESALYKRISYP